MKVTEAPDIQSLILAMYGYAPPVELVCGEAFANHNQIGCGATLTISLLDIFTETEGHPAIGRQIPYFVCPCCKNQQIFPPTEIPQNFSVPTKEVFFTKKKMEIRAKLIALANGNEAEIQKIKEEFPI